MAAGPALFTLTAAPLSHESRPPAETPATARAAGPAILLVALLPGVDCLAAGLAFLQVDCRGWGALRAAGPDFRPGFALLTKGPALAMIAASGFSAFLLQSPLTVAIIISAGSEAPPPVPARSAEGLIESLPFGFLRSLSVVFRRAVYFCKPTLEVADHFPGVPSAIPRLLLPVSGPRGHPVVLLSTFADFARLTPACSVVSSSQSCVAFGAPRRLAVHVASHL